MNVTSPITDRVAVIGPNLLDQSRGDFHVHRFGCADTHKAEYRMHRDDAAYAWTVDSIEDVVTGIYPPSDFEYDAANWREYADGIHFFPCVNLPEVTA